MKRLVAAFIAVAFAVAMLAPETFAARANTGSGVYTDSYMVQTAGKKKKKAKKAKKCKKGYVKSKRGKCVRAKKRR